MHIRRRARRGVTLIEMLVVVTIIAIFAAVVSPPLLGRVDKTRVTAARTQIKQLLLAVGTYKLDTGSYPANLNALHPDHFSDDIPLDPWRNPYLYSLRHGEPAIVSLGADRRPGGDGLDSDIVSWKNN